jgi:hypothetical protein
MAGLLAFLARFDGAALNWPKRRKANGRVWWSADCKDPYRQPGWSGRGSVEGGSRIEAGLKADGSPVAERPQGVASPELDRYSCPDWVLLGVREKTAHRMP